MRGLLGRLRTLDVEGLSGSTRRYLSLVRSGLWSLGLGEMWHVMWHVAVMRGVNVAKTPRKAVWANRESNPGPAD